MNKRVNRAAPYLFLLPFLTLFVSFYLFPIIYSFIISLTKWNGIGEMEFVGFANYVRLITKDPLFYKSLLNTMKIMAYSMPLSLALGFFSAVLIRDLFKKSRVLYQFMNYSPNLVTAVAIGIIFAILFDSRIGPVNFILLKLGIIKEEISWLGNVITARMVIVIALVWKSYGYNMIIFMAGLSSIDKSLYEAATIDGANWWQTTANITLPLLKDTLIFLVTTGFIYGLQMFDMIITLFQHAGQPFGGPGSEFLTVIMHFYDSSFRRFNLGYGATVAYGLFVIIFVISIFNVIRMAKEQ
jgi:cellobiose transport system permease protein